MNITSTTAPFSVLSSSSSSSYASNFFAPSFRPQAVATAGAATGRLRRPTVLLRPSPSFLRPSPATLSTSLLPLAAAPQPPLDLTEDNVKQVLADARLELGQIFDSSVGITGEAELSELDGPFVKISLRGRFWHKRSTVLARLDNYLKKRIPEILEVDIEDEKQLDDSPENF